MKKTLRILGSVVLLAVLAWRVDFSRVGASLAGVSWPGWGAAVLCYVLAQVASALRWRQLARPLGFRNRLWEFVGFYFIGNFFNLLLPTSVGGDVVRACYLDGRTGRRWSAFLTVLADRLSGVVVLLVMAFLASLAVHEPRWVGWWGAASAGLVVAGLLGFWLVPRTSAGGSERGLWHKVRQMIEVGDVYRRSPRLLLIAFTCALAVQVLNAVMVWQLARALGLALPLGLFFALVPLVSLLALAPVSVNGMGVREGGLVLLLAPLGVAAEVAITLSLMWLSVFVAAGLAGAVCYLFGRFPRYQVETDDECVGGHPDQGRTRQSRSAA